MAPATTPDGWLRIVEAALLSAPGPLERRVAADNRLAEGTRISCLTRPLSDVTVRASYW